ncbi:WAS/WASL-interacting protein family member 3-like [Choloepus didactylus]|uniref:WAS/WASL-interacting protein family member 3-like n=1 Tax=Choloepus didactylus TaxID=27675 RepID=UPI00189F7538|nr:WAS/WASL-interacting protein family member 3-like [Choloepus didactylus]
MQQRRQKPRQSSAGKRGRSAGAGRGKDDEGEGRQERIGSNHQRTPQPRGAADPAREFLPGRLQPLLSGGGRKGFPVQEAAEAAAASSLTLLSPAPPIPHSPRRRVPAPLPADPHSPTRPRGLRAGAPSPPLPRPLIHSVAAGPTRRRRGGSGLGQGPREGGSLLTSLPHLGAAEPLPPAAAFSTCAALLAPSPKWRGPGVLAEQPPQPPPPPPPPPQPPRPPPREIECRAQR